MSVRVLFIFVVAYLVATSEAPAQTTSDGALIRAARAESNQAIAQQDVPAILASLEDESHVSTSSGAFLNGREEIGEAFTARFAESEDAVYVRTTESVDVSSAGPVASETGHWIGRWTTTQGPLRTGGRYVAYWRKSGGKWLIHAELYVPLFCEGPGCE